MLCSGSDFQFAERRVCRELLARPWGIGFGFGVLTILTALAIVTQAEGAKSYPTTPTMQLPADEMNHHENIRYSVGERPQDTIQPPHASDTGWRYSRTGWVQLAHEVGIAQQPLNWVQRMSPLVWAAALWSAATWILAWAE